MVPLPLTGFCGLNALEVYPLRRVLVEILPATAGEAVGRHDSLSAYAALRALSLKQRSTPGLGGKDGIRLFGSVWTHIRTGITPDVVCAS